MVKIGDVFGRLVVIGKDKLIRYKCGKKQSWLCKCECGKSVVVMQANLITCHSRSCGCLRSESASKQFTTHGECKKTPEYSLWLGINARCHKKNNSGYEKYGGRGVSVYEPWQKSYEEFLAYLLRTIGRRPSSKHSIDRIDNSKSYVPGNIRWATIAEQARNRSDNVWIEFDGRKMILQDWAKEVGLTADALAHRIKRGYEIRDVLDSRRHNGAACG
jgi:hypothetical protein